MIWSNKRPANYQFSNIDTFFKDDLHFTNGRLALSPILPVDLTGVNISGWCLTNKMEVADLSLLEMASYLQLDTDTDREKCHCLENTHLAGYPSLPTKVCS